VLLLLQLLRPDHLADCGDRATLAAHIRQLVRRVAAGNLAALRWVSLVENGQNLLNAVLDARRRLPWPSCKPWTSKTGALTPPTS
jgi:hypothetical protein